MREKLFYLGVIFSLLAVAAATPISVQAEGDPPPIPEPVKPPWITGINSNLYLSTAEQQEPTPAGIAELAAAVEVPLLAPAPEYVELEPQIVSDPLPAINSLAVPQQYQDPADVTCGAAALGMALEFLSLNGEGEAPSQAALVAGLKNSGLLNDTGTGVEELAFLARQHGFQGTSVFHDWTLAQLAEQLGTGTPVVVSLGSNGADQPGHFVTLTGISADGKWVSYNDPVLGKQTVRSETFQELWRLQGNSGLVARKEPLSLVNDPMLPWMGLFSALAALAVLAKQIPLGEEIAGAITDIRKQLSNPSRRGLGGKLEVGGAGGSSSPPYRAPAGYKWIQKSVPKYGWKNFTTTHSRQVPIFEKKKVQVDTEVWYENVPRYRTVRVDRGSWVNKKVTLYRRTKYVRYYRTSRVRKTRWVRRGWRLVQQTYYVTKRTPVYGYRSVPYRTYYKKEWKPRWVAERQLDGYTRVRHEKPVYEHLMMPTGRTKTEYYPKTEKRWGVIGTELEWQLKKKPEPEISLKPQVEEPEPKNITEPVLETVPSFFCDPLGWLQTSVINLGRQNETAKEVLTDTLAPAADWLHSFPGQVEDIADNLRESAQEMVTTGIEGWVKAYDNAQIIADYTIDAVKEGRWEDVGNVIKELSEVPGEVADALIDEYDNLPFMVQMGVGVAPGGDAIDIVKEVRNGTNGKPVDKFVLGLSIFGLIMDLGWADGVIPDPVDGGNAAAAFLKTLMKHVDEGPARETLEIMIKNPDKWDEIIESINVFIKHNDEFKTINNPEMMVWLLEKGPKQVETIATNVAKFGDDASEVVEVFQAGERLAEVGVHSDEASDLIDTILDMSIRGDGDRLVIGKYFEDGEGIGYLQHATGKDGGIYFQTPEGFYDDALGSNRELLEAINEEYIRRSLEGGIDRIDLVEETIAKVQDTRSGTFSDAEINWITETIRKINKDPAYDFTYIIENNPFGGNSWIKIQK